MNKTYKTAMDKLTMSEEKQAEVYENIIKSEVVVKKQPHKYKKLIYAASIAAAFVITILAIPATRAIAISAVESIQNIFTHEYSDGMKVTVEESTIEDETGVAITQKEEVEIPNTDVYDYVEVDGTKVYFTFNGEHIDITGEISESSFFRYDVTEKSGDKMIIFIGGNVDNMGLYKLYFKQGSKDWSSWYSGDNESDEWYKEINRNIDHYRIEVME